MNAQTGSSPLDRFWLPIVFLAFLYGVLSGIRPMSTWAATHFLFDYEFGVIKRGLVFCPVDSGHKCDRA